MHYFSNLFDKVLYMFFGHVHCPSSGVSQHCTNSKSYLSCQLCWRLLASSNKFEKQCISLDFIIRMIIRACSESNKTQFFFLGNYLFRKCQFHAQHNWMFPLHMLFCHIISVYVYGLTPARNKGMHAFPIPARFLFTQPCPHGTNHAFVIFKPYPMQCIFQGPQKMKI